MGIQYIPGPEQLLAPVAATIGEAVGRMINPNFQFQQGMRQALATNPGLIQQLADIEAMAPGTLGNLGFGNLTGTIGKTPQSAESEFKQKNRGKIQENAAANLQADTATATLTADQAVKMADMMKADPKLSAENALLKITGETETQRIRRPAAQLDANQAKVTMEAMRDVDVKQLGKVDMILEARKFVRGQADPTRMVQIMSVPQTAKIFDDALNTVMQERQMAHNIQLQNMRDDPMSGSTFLDQKAFMMFDQSNAGSPSVWKDYMYGNQGKGRRSEAEELAKKPLGELTPDQRDLVEVYNADKSMRFAATSKIARDYNVGLQRAIEDFRTGLNNGIPETEQQTKLQGIQDIIDAKAALTRVPLKVVYGKIPGSDSGWTKWIKDEGIYFVNPATDEMVPMKQVFGDYTPPTPTEEKTRIAPGLQSMITHFRSLSPGAQQAQLGVWETGDPAVYKQLIDALGIAKDSVGPKKQPPVTIR
jgi:hypothetical protein